MSSGNLTPSGCEFQGLRNLINCISFAILVKGLLFFSGKAHCNSSLFFIYYNFILRYLFHKFFFFSLFFLQRGN